MVPGPGHTAVFLAKQPDPGIGPSHAGTDFGPFVRGAIVYDQDLKITISLALYEAKTLAYVSFCIVHGYNDGYLCHMVHSPEKIFHSFFLQKML